jgi:hypothetical protein
MLWRQRTLTYVLRRKDPVQIVKEVRSFPAQVRQPRDTREVQPRAEVEPREDKN